VGWRLDANLTHHPTAERTQNIFDKLIRQTSPQHLKQQGATKVTHNTKTTESNNRDKQNKGAETKTYRLYFNPWFITALIMLIGMVVSYFHYSTCIIFRDNWTLEVRPIVATATIATLSHIVMSYYKENRKLGLFSAITFWVILGLIAYTALSAIWSNRETSFSEYLFAGWYSLNTNKLEQVKVTLTAIGGIGGVSFLVIKYREQSGAELDRAREEEGEADKKLVSAVEQLGSSSPQVRIAGVYAIAEVADTHENKYIQLAVNILSGYLRTDRSQNDSSVESTILSVLSNHLKPASTPDTRQTPSNNTGKWSSCSIDLHGARIKEAVKFDFAQIAIIDCRAAEFTGDVSFEGCKLGRALFHNTIFEKEANFRRASFTEANFNGAKFKQKAEFGSELKGQIEGANFKGVAEFRNTNFGKKAIFNHSTFNKACFRNSIFIGAALFQNVEFAGRADFGDKTIFESKAHFNGSSFNAAHFKDATFKGQVNFGKYDASRTTFVNTSNFSGARFEKKVSFQYSLFYDEAKFHKTIFNDQVNFQGGRNKESATTFKDGVHFCATNFKKYVNFKNVVFETKANFNVYRNIPTIFEEGVGFQGANFTCCNYHSSIFRKGADWGGAVVTDSNFRHALFNVKFTEKGKVVFCEDIKVGPNGLPEGANLTNFEPTEHVSSLNTNRQTLPITDTYGEREHYFGDYPL